MVLGARHARYCHKCNLGWQLKARQKLTQDRTIELLELYA